MVWVFLPGSVTHCLSGHPDLLEVALQQALQSLAVTGLVTSHLVDGVVDGIQAVGLGALSQIKLAGGSAELAVRESVRSGHFFTPKGCWSIICAIEKTTPNDATLWHCRKPLCGSRCHKNATL